MNCPNCASPTTTQLSRRTSLGYKTFRCYDCGRVFNERTGTTFNYLQFPTDIALLVVLWRLRYKLSLRDLPEMFLERGFEFTHEAVRDWEQRFAPLIAEQLRSRRSGKAGKSWYCDETYIRVGGKWCYLYRATDRDGNLVDSMLSEHRDREAAKRFFTQAREVVGQRRLLTGMMPILEQAAGHWDAKSNTERIRILTIGLSKNHRGIKQRYYPMRGFGDFDSASRFCSAFDEQRDYFRYRSRPKQKVSLPEQRHMFRERLHALQLWLITA